jgi:hypothetical protein
MIDDPLATAKAAQVRALGVRWASSVGRSCERDGGRLSWPRMKAMTSIPLPESPAGPAGSLPARYQARSLARVCSVGASSQQFRLTTARAATCFDGGGACPYQNLVQGGRSFGIHHQQHEIRRLAAQLEPDVDAFQSVRAVGNPALSCTTGQLSSLEYGGRESERS